MKADWGIASAELTALVWYSIDNQFYANALFLADRLYAFDNADEEALYLLANAHRLNGSTRTAQFLLKGATSLKARYLYAKCCLDLDEASDGEHVLLPAWKVMQKDKENISLRSVGKQQLKRERQLPALNGIIPRGTDPDEACVLHLLGDLCRRMNKVRDAEDYYSRCLQLNPFLWTAYEALCDMGCVVDPENIFYPFPNASDNFVQNSILTSAPKEAGAPLQTIHSNRQPSRAKTNSITVASPTVTSTSSMQLQSVSYSPENFFSYTNARRTNTVSNSTNSFLARLSSFTPDASSNSEMVRPITGNGLSLGYDFTMPPQPLVTPTNARSSFIDDSPPPISSIPANFRPPGTEMPGKANDSEITSSPTFKAQALCHSSPSATSVDRDEPRSKRQRILERIQEEEAKVPPSLLSASRDLRSTGKNDVRRSTRLHPSAEEITPSNQSPLLRKSNTLAAKLYSNTTATKHLQSGKITDTPTNRPHNKASLEMGVRLCGQDLNCYCFLQSSNSIKENIKGRADSKEASATLTSTPVIKPSPLSPLPPAHRSAIYSSTPEVVNVPPQSSTLNDILTIFRAIGSGYFHLCQLQCQEALADFKSLDSRQYETGWVLCKVGRCHFEMVEYPEAEHVFRRARELEPCRLKDMEFYSTLLWHLHKEIQLASFAHELIELDRTSPQAWCAVGNTFSLQKDYDQALKCFQRAIQVDPHFAYAHTLQGHEYVSNEDYDKAQNAFRAALRIDRRHYNAWYGLGQIYLRLGKLEFAEYHFKKASDLNPCNAVLLTCVGIVQDKLHRPVEALDTYNRATRMNPSPLVRFKKAKTLMLLKRYKDAMEELEELKQLAPEESSVYFLMGTLFKQMGDKRNAMMHFTWALDLNPRSAQAIKDAIEKLSDGPGEESTLSGQKFPGFEMAG